MTSFLQSIIFIALFQLVPMKANNHYRHFRTPIRNLAKVACQPENIKENEHYVCTKEGQIVCLYGWQNPDRLCQEPVCQPPCNASNGYCSNPNTCTCNVGYKGPTCSKCVTLPGCGNGYCHKSYECRCNPGWQGTFCNKPICKEGCKNGYCSVPGECVCQPGWKGEDCSECIKLPGCRSNGYCDKPMECKCRGGWTGNFCQTAICSKGCNSTNGLCQAPDECWCRVGWKGETCDICEPYPNCRGYCNKPWDCICRPGKTGKLCDIDIVKKVIPGQVGGPPTEIDSVPISSFKPSSSSDVRGQISPLATKPNTGYRMESNRDSRTEKDQNSIRDRTQVEIPGKKVEGKVEEKEGSPSNLLDQSSEIKREIEKEAREILQREERTDLNFK